MAVEEEGENENESIRTDSVDTDDLISRVDIAEETDYGNYQSLTTSAVLSHCKHKILRPYLRLLAVIGLRGFAMEQPNVPILVNILGYVHLSQVILFMIFGYILQYMACFRRDRGFCYKNLPTYKTVSDHSQICYGSTYYSFIIPSLLHFIAFLYSLYMMRIKETEQLQNLMERTFLLSAHRTDGPRKQHLLVQYLWIFISLSILWMALSFSSVLIMLSNGNVVIRWLHSDKYKIFLEIILIISTLWHDMVQATIITSYCLQVKLLSSSLFFLRGKLLQHTIQPLTWVREINECQIFLTYLNKDFAPAVGIFTFVNISWALSGIFWLLKFDAIDTDTKPITIVSILIVILWTVAALAPFIMAAWLTSACSMLRNVGHEVRIRPFVYQDTPGEDLDTILLFTSTLKMKSKLFSVPITGHYLFLFITVIGILLLTLGQCHVL